MLRHLTALTVVLLPLAACGGTPAIAAPAVAKDRAAQLLAHYQAVNNRANGTSDERLLATVETGAQLDMDRAEYRRRTAAKEKYTPFVYSAPAYYIPRETGFPKWFAVVATAGRTRHALVFTQERPKGPWLLTADPFPAETITGVALDKDGYATAVAPDDGRTAPAPGKIAAVHAATLTRGTSGMAPGPYTTQAHDALVKAEAALKRRGVTLTSDFRPDRQQAFALRTTDGGALVWYVVRQSESYDLARPGLIGNGGDLAGLISGKVRRHLDTTALTQYLAVVPPQGAAKVVGSYRKAIQATES
ncbi:hypothetical protein NE235_32855 [Actinoallomurus spadix]|uniref:DUF8094 domain-containing protein n=1 Tax=Actinoallomurus spadix TaxID=79912 RepID=A0ABP3G6I8_9ACTN|nr:hypothetical protein [Actinoallomurus spadix]MCO5990912.1 hypothetical protein [Actinoallomurus spadix]